MSDPPALQCLRCGATTDPERLDITSYGDATPRSIPGYAECPTPGCVDEFGSRYVPPPDVPGQLTYEDQQWLRRHWALITEGR